TFSLPPSASHLQPPTLSFSLAPLLFYLNPSKQGKLPSPASLSPIRWDPPHLSKSPNQFCWSKSRPPTKKFSGQQKRQKKNPRPTSPHPPSPVINTGRKPRASLTYQLVLKQRSTLSGS